MGDKSRNIILSLRSRKISLCSSGICEWGLDDVQVIHQWLKCLQPFRACRLCPSGVFELILSRCKCGVNVLFLPHCNTEWPNLITHRNLQIIKEKSLWRMLKVVVSRKIEAKPSAPGFTREWKTAEALENCSSVCSDPRGLWGGHILASYCW